MAWDDWLLGGLRGVGNILSGQKKAKANKAEAEYNLDQLELKQANLEDTYELNQEKLLDDLDAALDAGTQGLWSATVAQQNNMIASANTNVANQSAMYAQLASIQREGSRAVGSVINAVAGSGFRNTGSGANAISEQEREAQRSYEANLSVMQTSRDLNSRILDVLK